MIATQTSDRLTRVSFDRHVEQVLGMAAPTSTIVVDLGHAQGSVLAENVSSPVDLPAFDNSAMDGYALRSSDLALGHGVLPVSGDIPAGHRMPAPLPRGTAARIMTGAPVPDGADTVVQVEWTDAGTDNVTIHRLPFSGGNVRHAAAELGRGASLLTRGVELTPVRLGLLAAVGVHRIRVHRRPRVAVLTTGSELVEPGAARPPGGVFDVNGPLLAALLGEDGATTTALPIHPDDPDRVRSTLLDAASEHDLVLTVGGISAGAYEVVRQALHPDAGGAAGQITFRQVAMTPGRPQGLGRIGATPVLALPGNPTAALVSYLVFVRPFIRRCRGVVEPTTSWAPVAIGEAIHPRPDVVKFVPAVADRHRLSPVARTVGDSHCLTSFADAEILLRIDPRHECLVAGSVVPALQI